MDELDKKLKELLEKIYLSYDAIMNYDTELEDNPFSEDWMGKLMDNSCEEFEILRQKEGVEYCDDCGTFKPLDQLMDCTDAHTSGNCRRQTVCRKCIYQCDGCNRQYLVNNELHGNYQKTICPYCQTVKTHINTYCSEQCNTGLSIQGELI